MTEATHKPSMLKHPAARVLVVIGLLATFSGCFYLTGWAWLVSLLLMLVFLVMFFLSPIIAPSPDKAREVGQRPITWYRSPFPYFILLVLGIVIATFVTQ
ncbi:hypothetical protein [Aestuariibacter salexigens]|uniref:hypothetical protein n=1 Tax=Aestuariibacter salexigens TaxID=226010 RepID=UPI0003F69F11|nr:hypothetical protein [Aestuariibacter salexigens]